MAGKIPFCGRSKSASKADKNSVLSSDIHYDNVYMKGFLSNLYLRPSCHDCKCKDGKHHSDISLGDFGVLINLILHSMMIKV